MTASRIRIGILGGGMISQIAHLPFYRSDPRCDLVAISESRPSLVAALTPLVGADRIFADHRELLAHPDIDAVVISTPRPATGPLTLMALEAGKHVLAEKPMAHTVEQAQRLVDEAAARKLVYAIGFMKRYDPGVRTAKALFETVRRDDNLGPLLLARFYDYSNAYAMAPPAHVRPQESRTIRFPTWPLYPDWLPERFRAAYSWFLNAGSHDINLLRYFFSDSLEVGFANAHDDWLIATMHGETSPIELAVAKVEAGRWLEGAEFLFKRGRIRLTIPSPMAVGAVAELILDDPARGISAARQPVENGWSFAHQARDFVDALLGKSKPSTEGSDGLADLDLTERIWRKAVGGSCPSC
jgi:predicted dehydrogenase